MSRASITPICASSRSARRDFLAIAENFHTLVVDHIPVIRPDERNEAKRFIILIDALYDQKVKLIASADAEPEQLYRRRTGPRGLRIRAHRSRLIGNALGRLSGPAAWRAATS